MIKLHCIASGSKGNAVIIFNNDTTILIDCGITRSRLIEGLNEINKTIDDINFALFTHDHSDHIKGEKFIENEKKYTVLGVLNLELDHILKFFKVYKFGSFNITLLKTSHDATNSCGFLINDNDESLVYITDSGYLPSKTLKIIKDKTYYFIESNHDLNLLENSNRPKYLIDRILSKRGHLSNEDSANYMSKLIGVHTKEIILAHLSEECNRNDLAINTYKTIFTKNNINIDKLIIKCAEQSRSIDL